jgi:hypothetical protein
VLHHEALPAPSRGPARVPEPSATCPTPLPRQGMHDAHCAIGSPLGRECPEKASGRPAVGLACPPGASAPRTGPSRFRPSSERRVHVVQCSHVCFTSVCGQVQPLDVALSNSVRHSHAIAVPGCSSVKRLKRRPHSAPLGSVIKCLSVQGTATATCPVRSVLVQVPSVSGCAPDQSRQPHFACLKSASYKIINALRFVCRSSSTAPIEAQCCSSSTADSRSRAPCTHAYHI